MKYYVNEIFYKYGILLALLLIGLCYPSFGQNNLETGNTNRSDTIQAGLQGSVNPLNANPQIYTGEDLLDESFPNSWPLFGSGTRLRIGGYVKADFIHDFNYVADRFEFELGSIAVDGSPERELGGITTFHAKESRINFDFRSKAQWKNGKEFPMKVFMEIDFFNDSETLRLNARLRQAYGVIGRLLIGRTWTTSGDLTAIPSVIDFSGGDALYGGRLVQIRWQDNINNNLTYAIALEDPAGQIDNPLNLAGAFRPLFPNLASMIRYKSNKGSTIQLGLDVFGLSWKGPNTVPNVTNPGFAVTVTSRVVIDLKPYKDAFTWGGGFGEGQAHRIISLSWDGKASGVVDNTDLTLAPSWFAYAGYNHYWTSKLNSNLATYWSGTTLTDIQSDNTITGAGSVHANLIYFPYKRASIGVEYMWGVRENKDGIQGVANRLQFMAKYLFN